MAKLMLVEDDNNLREIYEARLQAEGYDIVTARDGEEALVVAKANKPDLIISDVMMPKISGFEMLDILRNTDGLKEVKVIMLTALGQADDQQRGDKLGADRYLVKSQVTLEDIVKVAHDLLGDGGGAATPPAAPEPSAPPAAPAPADPVAVASDKPSPTPSDDGVVAEPPAASDKPAAASVSVPVTDGSALVIEEPSEEAANAASDEASNDAQPAAQEEASMEAKIEDFVEGASSEATPAAEAPTSEAEPPAAPEVDADLPSALPEDTPAGATTVVKSDDKAESKEDLNANVQIAGKKVIEPIDSSPKRDLDALLAAEAAKEAAAAGPLAATAVVATEEGTAETPLDPKADPAQAEATDFAAGKAAPKPGDQDKPADPNSIAL